MDRPCDQIPMNKIYLYYAWYYEKLKLWRGRFGNKKGQKGKFAMVSVKCSLIRRY